MSNGRYSKDKNNISKVVKEVEKARKILAQKDREGVKMILDTTPEDDMSEESLDLLIYVYKYALEKTFHDFALDYLSKNNHVK